MRWGLFAALLAGCLATDAFADHRTRYPRVYGATGRPYGPTQAHYQYQRQYGRAWHGYGGQTLSRRNSRIYYSAPASYSAFNYYYGPAVSPYGYSYYGPTYSYPVGGGVVGAPGFYNYGPVYSYTPFAPQAIQAFPEWVGRNPFNNDVLNRAKLEEQLRWKSPVKVPETKNKPVRIPKQSTPAARIKSLEAQARGDHFLSQQKYGSAWERYRTAFQTAPERAEPYFRTGFALAGMQRFAEAVKYFKRGLELDPNWPTTGESLGKIYGRRNTIAKNSILSDATRWVKDDIRDPDRLFVLGVLLYFDNKTDEAATLFEAAWRLSGGGDHLKPFLQKKKAVTQRGKIQPKAFEVKPRKPQQSPANGPVDLTPPEPPKPPIANQPKGPKNEPLVPPLPKG